MVDICEDNLDPFTEKDCWFANNTRVLGRTQSGHLMCCRLVLLLSDNLLLPSRQKNVKIMNAYVIIYNKISESEGGAPVIDDQLYDLRGPCPD
jgi:hypothetical protein